MLAVREGCARARRERRDMGRMRGRVCVCEGEKRSCGIVFWRRVGCGAGVMLSSMFCVLQYCGTAARAGGKPMGMIRSAGTSIRSSGTLMVIGIFEIAKSRSSAVHV